MAILADSLYKHGDIRLVDGSKNWKGRVEIFWLGVWSTISDVSWTDADAIVACKQLGFSTSGIIIA